MKQYLLVTEWLALDSDVRYKLIERFNIHKSGVVEVMNNKLVCDGVTQRDLLALNLGHLVDVLGEDLEWYRETIFDELFKNAVDKIMERGLWVKEPEVQETAQVNEVSSEASTPVSEAPAPKKRGRPKKII